MTGSELRRFVGGPFPNLVPGPSGAGTVRGPFPTLVPADRRDVVPDAPVIVPLATVHPTVRETVDPAGVLSPGTRLTPA